jgi:hypothetical protein
MTIDQMAKFERMNRILCRVMNYLKIMTKLMQKLNRDGLLRFNSLRILLVAASYWNGYTTEFVDNESHS